MESLYIKRTGKDSQAHARLLLSSHITENTKFTNSTGVMTNDQSLTRQISNKSIEHSLDRTGQIYTSGLQSQISYSKHANPSPVPLSTGQKSRNTSPLDSYNAMKSSDFEHSKTPMSTSGYRSDSRGKSEIAKHHSTTSSRHRRNNDSLLNGSTGRRQKTQYFEEKQFATMQSTSRNIAQEAGISASDVGKSSQTPLQSQERRQRQRQLLPPSAKRPSPSPDPKYLKKNQSPVSQLVKKYHDPSLIKVCPITLQDTSKIKNFQVPRSVQKKYHSRQLTQQTPMETPGVSHKTPKAQLTPSARGNLQLRPKKKERSISKHSNDSVQTPRGPFQVLKLKEKNQKKRKRVSKGSASKQSYLNEKPPKQASKMQYDNRLNSGRKSSCLQEYEQSNL